MKTYIGAEAQKLNEQLKELADTAQKTKQEIKVIEEANPEIAK